jgi:hypothetical protein
VPEPASWRCSGLIAYPTLSRAVERNTIDTQIFSSRPRPSSATNQEIKPVTLNTSANHAITGIVSLVWQTLTASCTSLLRTWRYHMKYGLYDIVCLLSCNGSLDQEPLDAFFFGLCCENRHKHKSKTP